MSAAAAPAPGRGRAWHLLVVSARTPGALERATARIAVHLRQPAAGGDGEVAELALRLQVGRRHLPWRRFAVCASREDAAGALAAGDGLRRLTGDAPAAARPVAFMFPGGGAQHVNMGRGLYEQEPAFRAEIDRCARLARPHLGCDLRDVLYPPAAREAEAADRITDTAPALVTLFAVEHALARLWISWGVRPRAMIGHSLGEYVAACLAGVLSTGDALALVALRGRLIEELPAGRMLSVSLPEAEVAGLLGDDLDIGIVNSPSQCVVSGPAAAIERMAASLAERGVDFRQLDIRAAGHSRMLAPVLDRFAAFVARIPLHRPRVPYLSNVTGTWVTPAQATDPRYWVDHLRRTVRFSAGLAELMADPRRVLLEVGPGHVLGALARLHAEQSDERRGPAGGEGPARVEPVQSLRHRSGDLPDLAFLLNSLGRLWLSGVAVDWHGFSATASVCR